MIARYREPHILFLAGAFEKVVLLCDSGSTPELGPEYNKDSTGTLYGIPRPVSSGPSMFDYGENKIPTLDHRATQTTSIGRPFSTREFLGTL